MSGLLAHETMAPSNGVFLSRRDLEMIAQTPAEYMPTGAVSHTLVIHAWSDADPRPEIVRVSNVAVTAVNRTLALQQVLYVGVVAAFVPHALDDPDARSPIRIDMCRVAAVCAAQVSCRRHDGTLAVCGLLLPDVIAGERRPPVALCPIDRLPFDAQLLRPRVAFGGQ